MGCLSFVQEGQAQNYAYPVQTIRYPNQNVNNQNQNVFIKFPDPKLFELDPNFLKGCNKIEKVTYDTGVYEGEMKNGKRNGKGKMTWTSDIYEGEWKDDEVIGELKLVKKGETS